MAVNYIPALRDFVLRTMLIDRLYQMRECRSKLVKLEGKLTGGEWDTPKVGDSPMDYVSDAVRNIDKAIELTENWIRTGRKY